MLPYSQMVDKKWEDKVWGRTKQGILTPRWSYHFLEVVAGGYCSFHYHLERANRFFVESGVIRIVWCFGWKVESQILSADNTLTIESLVPHQFQVLESGKMTEEYWPDRGGFVHDGDITRLTKGNKIDDQRLDFIRDTIGILKHDGTFWEGGE